MMFVQTKVDTLARLTGAASDDGARYYLCGVHVRRRANTAGVIVEATNGHILALEHDAAGDCSGDNAHSLIVCRHAIADIVKAAKGFAKAQRVKFEDLRVTVWKHTFQLRINGAETPELHLTTQNGTPAHAFIDGAFPDVERVVPQPKPTATAGTHDAYNARLLFQLAQTSGGDTERKRERALPFLLYGPKEAKELGSPAVMRVSGAPDWLGVIMPMRVDGPSTFARPSWFFGVTPKAVAAE